MDQGPRSPLNLLLQPWLPVLRQGGKHEMVRPAQIAEADNLVVGLDWPRADFRIAGLEFLIGLLATACPPEDGSTWLDWWHSPPSPATLDAALAPFAHAFDLDGDGPRFLQDREDLVSDPEPIERLLIESPGASTLRQNTDLLVHRGRVARLGRPAAAMALYTFQGWAPAGGAGNRTGLRGGGPLTTLVLPGERPTLWQTLWANVPVRPEGPPAPEEYPLVFPWLAPTVTSEGNRGVTPEQSHPLQAWWGMPRRIRLDFAPGDQPCDLTGSRDGVQVTSWRQRPRGANYVGWGRVHPLSPYYAQKPGDAWLPVHPQPGGIGYRHWLGLVMRDREGLRLPAQSVHQWRETRERDVGRPGTRLLAAGYDMDNMKARGFVESEMPLPPAADKEKQENLATALILSANQVAAVLRSAVRQALFSPGATVKLEAELFSSLRERVWEATEAGFFERLAAQPEDAKASWLHELRRLALALFDEAAPLTPENGALAPRISRARRGLVFALSGFGKEGAALFGLLGLAAAQPKAKKGRGKAA
ncbi:type I-E CRISPR-associated protein Cse1/CasA [Siccirubricoccus phaeus]|uniref:type I-E CRISPR-associated protein Cse1/CasA n=1 Tax=Siccirubricoccus phaeus TaxID=2595053 RepID=UPI0022A69B54|nr:type I-E CRISPR-associated protein Cse1/CasA [Siccirubricoccus phaeus]